MPGCLTNGEYLMDINGNRGPKDTPCVGVCSTTNLGDKVCKGCGRTDIEVIEWNTYSDYKKILINERLLNNHK